MKEHQLPRLRIPALPEACLLSFSRIPGRPLSSLRKAPFYWSLSLYNHKSLRENTHYKQSHSTLIFSHFGVQRRLLTGRWKRKRFRAAKTKHRHPRPCVTLASVRRTPGRRKGGRAGLFVFFWGRGWVLSQRGMEGRRREPSMSLPPLASASVQLGPTGEVVHGGDG